MPLFRALSACAFLVLCSLVSTAQPGGPTLQITGECPGPIDVLLQNATPGGSVTFALGDAGSFTIPGGPCGGTQLGLGNPQVLGTVTADGSGSFQATFTVPFTFCQKSLQAVDIATCQVTNVATIPAPDPLQEKPDGSGLFLFDPHADGKAGSVEVLSLEWGRLVDVHDVDDTGTMNPMPLFRDIVISELIQTDDIDYVLETNPITQKTRLTILRTLGAPAVGGATFLDLLLQATSNLSPILPKSDDPGTLPPFSFIARNAALVIRLDDLMDDDDSASLSLPDDVKVLTDYPPTIPFTARIFFDPNYGGIAFEPAPDGGGGGGTIPVFHSTRVVVDMTVSEVEAASMAVPAPVNLLGLPSSEPSSPAANVSVRMPSQTDPGSGQFTILRNLSGASLDTSSGPVDFGSPTVDVVRAMRSGNEQDSNNGFLLDLERPELLGRWNLTVDAAVDDPAGNAGFDFLVDVTFPTPCRAAPHEGDIIEVPGLFLEVTADALPPDPAGQVPNVAVTVLSDQPAAPGDLLGAGAFLRTYAAGLLPSSLEACWISFNPVPGGIPATGIAPASQISARFSEPMDPESLRPFDTLLVRRGSGGANPTPADIVVGEIQPSSDLTVFTYTPLLPFAHVQGTGEGYGIVLGGPGGDPTDLAGNRVQLALRPIRFQIDPDAPTESNGGFVLRFNSLDEVVEPPQADGAPDIRGQFLFDPTEGEIRPRPVTRFPAVADRTQAVPGIMIPFPPGVSTPLNPLGAKLQTVWRYCDVGFSTEDETNHNVDVEGLAWAPIGGQVVADVYSEFEIRLSHGHYLPDEHLSPTSLLPTKPQSGLVKTAYADNVLVDPESPQAIVHPKPLGYTVNPIDLFQSTTGTLMVPYPLNKTAAGQTGTYTWRDTAIQAEAGPNGNGIDLQIMEDVGTIPPGQTGAIAVTGQVPSIGLPLLMEYRTYPDVGAVGLNAFDISLAINTSRIPAFRVFSAGGVDSSGSTVLKDPDLEVVPSGGFNPFSTPPGQPTPPDDNSFYIGQMDLVTRISRAHTIWIDTGIGAGVDFVAPVLEPKPENQPGDTEVIVAWRGATAIVGQSGPAAAGTAFDADTIDPYGDIRNGVPTPLYLGDSDDVVFVGVPNDETWKDEINDIDGARYAQARITFVGDTDAMLTSSLTSLGVAFTTP